MEAKKIRFEDRNDLLEKLVVKKGDPKVGRIATSLAANLQALKRGDKQAAKEVIRLRKQMLMASAEVYIELDEDNIYDTIMVELDFMEEFEE